MVRIKIGHSERPATEASPSWIREHLDQAQRSGEPICVRVFIKSGSLDLVLSTPGCGSGGGGGGRAPNVQEREIFDLWAKRGLDSGDFSFGQLNAFLKQVKHL